MNYSLPGSSVHASIYSRQAYWSGLPFPSPGDLLNPGIEPRSLAWQADSLHLSHEGSPLNGLPSGRLKLLTIDRNKSMNLLKDSRTVGPCCCLLLGDTINNTGVNILLGMSS